MAYEFTVFTQDLDAAVRALGEEDFENLNIFSNRIMGNAILGDDRKLALPGFFLKDVYVLVASLKVRSATSPFSTVMSLTRSYAKRLQARTKNKEFSEDDLWSAHHDFLKSIRHHTLTPIEDEAYSSENPEFTHKAFKWLLSYLQANQSTLLHSKNQLLRGINNEMSRLYRCHGGEMTETHAVSLMTALGRCDDYVKVIARNPDEFEKLQEESILPLVERMVRVLEAEPPLPNELNSLLWDLIKKWRLYFLQYMENRRTSVEIVSEPEKGIELPEETRKKLTSAITKSLEGELESKK